MSDQILEIDGPLELADRLLQRAVEFAPTFKAIFDRNRYLHATAIALELALKSIIASEGVDEDELHRLRHDIVRATNLARKVGFKSSIFHNLTVSMVHPHFQRGGFQRFPTQKWRFAQCAVATWCLRVTVQRAARMICLQRKRLRKEALQHALSKLDGSDRLVFMLAASGSLAKEIAALLDRPSGEVETKLVKALSDLDRQLPVNWPFIGGTH